MPEKRWQTYEEVAAYLLNQLSEHFGVGRFEGKQIVAGKSGTEWEIDAKGCAEGGGRVIVVECKRHTKSGISQAITGSLAWTIQDVGADGGILVSPLGLQEGAKKVAAKANIVEVVLNQDSTTTDYMLSFLNQIHIGISETVHITEHLLIEVRDKDGNVVDRREY
ncbi:restriction endonuclease [Nitrosomonas sp. Nm58]|uniref:restriction endonuclease n=1 Tax=Nitrosomonas sp. Nm58 TaxID=200126 RepID=UPI00089AA0B0|nr:restriction endonuclease [Nitrosomonas sp. Nm58]SDY47309.1 Restriction endonuclease [Nitrosomonas sp. Nm58]